MKITGQLLLYIIMSGFILGLSIIFGILLLRSGELELFGASFFFGVCMLMSGSTSILLAEKLIQEIRTIKRMKNK